VALFHPQVVCYLVLLGQNQLLTLLCHCATLRQYVIWSFGAESAADPLVALFHLQWVCYLVFLMQNQLMNLLGHCSNLRRYAIW
jgi:hypothetical protein